MNHWPNYLIVAICSLLVGCTSTRSISSSGYQRGNYCGDGGRTHELDEFDVLGISRDDSVSEEEIRTAIAKAQRVKLIPGSSILLIQSGAAYPDGPMMTQLGRHFAVVPFSGVAVEKEREPLQGLVRRGQTVRNAAIVTDPDKPVTVVPLSSLTTDDRNTDPKKKRDASSYSRSLRLAAARGGNETIVCYWGILESASEHLPTKTISWVPIVNWMVPDEQQHMRIRLKVAVIDVRSGNWSVFSPEPFEDKRLSVTPLREVVDQKQVQQLKQKAYEASARELVRLFAADSAH